MEPFLLQLGADRSLHGGRVGDGRDIVLIHGALTTHVDWLEQPLGELARRGRVFAVDRPGHGQSRRPRFKAGPRDQAAQIREGLLRLGVKRPVLVGHSLGGMVALAWAEQWPEEVAGLVLLAPITHGEPRPLEHLALGPRALPLIGPMLAEVGRWTTDGALLAFAQRAMFHPHPPPAAWLARFPEKEVRKPEATVAEGEDAAALLPGSPAGMLDLRRVMAPVSIVAGRRDLVVDHRRHAEALARQLPQADLRLLDGVGHMPHHCALEAVLAAFHDLVDVGQAAA